ncbi:MAG: amidohydrolase family protein [Candidatus Competibacteraceae bacterium]|nr:amidohydrolase family protein [Candidatus Competibacteraceae bacterium]
MSGGREFEHRLMDFNNSGQTSFSDIKKVLSIARERVAQRLDQSQADLSIRNVTVIDGRSDTAFLGDVIIQNGKVVAVERAGSNVESRESIDGTGRFLMPGLIDMHVHVAGFAERPEALGQLLAAGVTTARDMGGHVTTLARWRDEIARGVRSGPELLIVGPTLNGEANAPFHRVVTTPEDAVAAVQESADAGAVQIKVHNAISPEVLGATISAAKQRRLDVVGHLPPGPGPLALCHTGMKEIAHSSALLESVLWRQEQSPVGLIEALEELKGPQSDELYACMARNTMAYAPNLSMYEPLIAGLEEPQASMTRRLTGVLGEISLRAKDAGVLILAASDANGDAQHPSFGTGLHDELRLLVGAGFTPMEAIRTATSNAALHLHRNDIGVIATGAQADLLLLCADPTQKSSIREQSAWSSQMG